ncbi:MAG: hypothetical protein DWQ31_19340 [Planctomycetota bacterium]|nr:MAG: hypothetical protein DWQ31_19340 [Planctomycetota bacterium]
METDAGKIAILGAGPIGLEAALYARYLGYQVDVYEQGTVAENVGDWGHVRMFSPFGMNRSTLGLAALAAQDPNWTPPDDDALLTGAEWADRYLLPLAESDLLRGHIHQATRVVGVSRADALKHELIGDDERRRQPFRLLLEAADGQRTAEANLVIDATGTYGNHNWLGRGGLPAVGEAEAAAKIGYRVPDVLGRERDDYAGQHTVVLGAGYSAATTVRDLAQLAREVPETRVTWLVRGDRPPGEPIARMEDDTLAERDALARHVAAVVEADDGPIDFHAATAIERISVERNDVTDEDGSLVVETSGRTETQLRCDRIVANVGYHGDRQLYEQLQVYECYATGAPMKLAASLVGQTSADCLRQSSGGPELLVTSEPDFYILGSKSYGRDSRFLVAIGLAQVRELFSSIAGRESLNLYQDVAGLISK